MQTKQAAYNSGFQSRIQDLVTRAMQEKQAGAVGAIGRAGARFFGRAHGPAEMAMPKLLGYGRGVAGDLANPAKNYFGHRGGQAGRIWDEYTPLSSYEGSGFRLQDALPTGGGNINRNFHTNRNLKAQFLDTRQSRLPTVWQGGENAGAAGAQAAAPTRAVDPSMAMTAPGGRVATRDAGFEFSGGQGTGGASARRPFGMGSAPIDAEPLTGTQRLLAAGSPPGAGGWGDRLGRIGNRSMDAMRSHPGTMGAIGGAAGMGAADEYVDYRRRDALRNMGGMKRLGLALQMALNPEGAINSMRL